jgi:hypothetical protein
MKHSIKTNQCIPNTEPSLRIIERSDGKVAIVLDCLFERISKTYSEIEYANNGVLHFREIQSEEAIYF